MSKNTGRISVLRVFPWGLKFSCVHLVSPIGTPCGDPCMLLANPVWILQAAFREDTERLDAIYRGYFVLLLCILRKHKKTSRPVTARATHCARPNLSTSTHPHCSRRSEVFWEARWRGGQPTWLPHLEWSNGSESLWPWTFITHPKWRHVFPGAQLGQSPEEKIWKFDRCSGLAEETDARRTTTRASLTTAPN